MPRRRSRKSIGVPVDFMVAPNTGMLTDALAEARIRIESEANDAAAHPLVVAGDGRRGDALPVDGPGLDLAAAHPQPARRTARSRVRC